MPILNDNSGTKKDVATRDRRSALTHAASPLPTREIVAGGVLLTSDGTPIVRVKAVLTIHAQGWSGRLWLVADRPATRQAARFWLRLDSGGEGQLTVRYRNGADYLVDGTGPFKPAAGDWQPEPAGMATAAVQQATLVVAEAVRTTLVSALRGAKVCGCRQCLVEAAQTATWAAGLLDPRPTG